MKLYRSKEYEEWFKSLNSKLRYIVEDRLSRIEDYNHFGDVKNLGEGLVELRWKNGIRVYFSRLMISDEANILLILGGNKNAQKKDIQKARLLIFRYKANYLKKIK